MADKMIPMLDVSWQYRQLKSEIDAVMQEVAERGRYILGPNVKALEKEIAEYCGCQFGIGVGNCTDALHLALRALRVGPGDEVITTPFTFVATTEAIGIVGATPVFVDIDPATYNIDVSKIEAAITPRTKAIIPVHLYGQPCDMDPLMEVARKHGLKVVEDCAQALGATYRGKKVGSFGDVGCFSFFPSKNLSCMGDGGMCVTNDPDIAERIEMLRRHGGKIKYHHTEIGLNSRLDELHAAVLRVKFRKLDEWNSARIRVADTYDRLLEGMAGVEKPFRMPEAEHVFHQYTIRVPNRDKVQARMKEFGVETMVYYPVPLHLQEVHAHLGYSEADCPEAVKAARECLSIPMGPEMDTPTCERVVNALRASLES
jgi:dTDP-4-amino-4,6-dideoxygalactose transaminase